MTEKLSQSVKAHLAICALLESSALSSQTKRQLLNLKRLLELEISAMQSEPCANAVGNKNAGKPTSEEAPG
jgi:hypothetical protein